MGDVFRAYHDVTCVVRARLSSQMGPDGMNAGIYLPDESGQYTIKYEYEVWAEAPTDRKAQSKLYRLVGGFLDRDERCGLVGDLRVEKIVPFWTWIKNFFARVSKDAAKTPWPKQ